MRDIKDDSKAICNYVRSKQKRKHRVAPLKTDDRKEVLDDVEAAQ